MIILYFILLIGAMNTTINNASKLIKSKNDSIDSYPKYLFYASFYDGTLSNDNSYDHYLLELQKLTKSLNSFSSIFIDKEVLAQRTTFAVNQQERLFRVLFTELKTIIAKNFNTLFDIVHNHKTAWYLDMCETYLLTNLSTISSIDDSEPNTYNIFIRNKINIEEKIKNILFSSKFNCIFKAYFKCVKLALLLFFRNDFVTFIIYTFKKFIRYDIFQRFLEVNSKLLSEEDLERVKRMLEIYKKETYHKTRKAINSRKWKVFDVFNKPKVKRIKISIEDISKITEQDFGKYLTDFEQSLYNIKAHIDYLIEPEDWDWKLLKSKYTDLFLIVNKKFLVKTFIQRKTEELLSNEVIKLTSRYLYWVLFEEDDKINNDFFKLEEKKKDVVIKKIERNKDYKKLRIEMEMAKKYGIEKKHSFRRIDKIKTLIEKVSSYITEMSI
eukprot:GAHX01000996.1.p1 GENE.GAHX01000996.1~~GAHX01000996.1.p1  ORF type:complete len:440 (+),score=90.41 GAHX01000996.1:2579-3898(+)